MTRKARLTIIGAGTAGLTALKEARRHTDDVLLINDGPYGTTCARVGCMPSKALLEVAHALDRRHFLASVGIGGTEGLSVDLAAVLAHVRRLRDRFVAGPIRLAESLGDRNLHGRPRFLDPRTLELDGERIETEATVIATGSRPIVPDPWRKLGTRVLTTDDIFEQENLGPRAAVIGLGGVGTEFGQALAQLGLEVHAFDRGGTVGGLSDPAVSQAALDALESSMAIRTGADARISEADGGRLRVQAGDAEAEVDWVLAALGRRPNLDGLGLDTLGVELDRKGMPPLDRSTLRVGDLPIYIAGDVNGVRPLMHEGADEGRIAAYHALHPQAECLDRRAPLAIVFTEPNLARVGHGHEDLRGLDHVTGETDFGQQPRAMMAGHNRGCLRVYVHVPDGRLLGAEMAVPRGEHLAHLLALAVQRRLTVDDLLQMPFYHPVVEEGLRAALQGARRELGKHRQTPDLPLCEEAAAWSLGGD